jgi:hypothetical protein
MLALAWEERDDDCYVDELHHNLVELELNSEDDRSVLIQNTRFLKKSPWGRVVNKKCLGLQHGDALCAVPPNMPDIQSLETVALPTKLWFFRGSKATSLNGLPLLWDVPDVHDCGIPYFSHTRMVIDVLHCVDLGVAQRWIGTSSCLVYN